MRAGLWLLAGLLGGVLGCGKGTVCLTAADCGDGMTCGSDGVCRARRGTTATSDQQRGGNRSGGSNANANNNTGSANSRQLIGVQAGAAGDAAQAWLGGRLGAQSVDVGATVEAWDLQDGETLGNATTLIVRSLDLTSGMLIVYLPQAVQDVPQGTQVALDGAQVCGVGDGSGAWSYDTYSTDGTVTVTPEGNGGVRLEVQVSHGDTTSQQALAQVHLPQL